MTSRIWRAVLLGSGGAYLALGLWAAIHPPSFIAILADFGPSNTHLVRDFAACAVTFGTGLVVAAHRTQWRTPALALAALWNGAHAVSHIIDIGRATPRFVGPLEAVLLVVLAIAFGALAQRSSKEDLDGDRLARRA